MIPALDQAGTLYEQNKLFLPQLMQCAETSKRAFALLKEHFASDAPQKGVVMMATVEGDIHDIGKNLSLIHIYCAYRKQKMHRHSWWQSRSWKERAGPFIIVISCQRAIMKQAAIR